MERRGVADDRLSPGLQDVGTGNRYQKPNGGPIVIIMEASLIPVEGICLDIDKYLSFCQHLEDLLGDCVPGVTKGLKIAESDCVSMKGYVLFPDTWANGDVVLNPSLAVFRMDIHAVQIKDLYASSTVPVLGVAGIIEGSRGDFIPVGVINRVGIEPKGLVRRKPVVTSMECRGWVAWVWWCVVGLDGQRIVTQGWVEAEGTRYWQGRGCIVTRQYSHICTRGIRAAFQEVCIVKGVCGSLGGMVCCGKCYGPWRSGNSSVHGGKSSDV